MSRIRPGAVIEARYELEALLGEGGYGVVYRARQLSTGQAVAVKFLLRDKLTSVRTEQIEQARFERELKLIAQLKHPHIVRLLDSGAADGKHPFMVLELVEGETLFTVLRRDGALGREEAAQLMFHVLDAMAFAHEIGVIHRDLKPQNVMLTRGGFRRNAMVLDFGVAGILKHARGASYVSLTARDEVRGTPAYMAPEQLLQGPLTPQTDLYAWGLLFIEALTGKTAVDAPTPFEAALRQADDDPIAIPDAIDDPELRRILARAVEKKLEHRYQSASEALHELQDWIGTAISARRPSSPEQLATTVPEPEPEPPPAAPPPAGRRVPLRLALVVLALVIAAGGLAWWSSQRGATTPASDAAEGEPPRCSGDGDCAAGQRCAPSGACVALEAAGCVIGAGDPAANPPPLVVGAIGHHDHPAYLARDQAMRLAIDEINEVGSLPGGRRLLYLACNDYGQSPRAVAAAQHLVELGAAAIIGPSSSEAAIDVVTRVTRAAGVLTLSPAATSPAISQLADDGLAWRTVPSDLAHGEAFAALVEALGVREVVVLARGDAYGAGLFDVITERLAEPLRGGLHVVRLPSPVSRGADFPGRVRAAVRPSAPLVVVLAAEEAAEIVRTYEAALPADAVLRPRYLLSESGRRPEVVALLRGEPGLVGRVEVVGPSDRNAAVYAPFALRHEARFGEMGEVSKVANAYDAAWVIGMLLAALGPEATPSGAALAAKMPALTSGERVAVGPGEAGRAMAALAGGGSVDLVGASGSLDFDPATGDVAGETLLWRAQLDLAGAPVFELAGRAVAGADGVRWTLPAYDADGLWRGDAFGLARHGGLDVSATEIPHAAWQRYGARLQPAPACGALPEPPAASEAHAALTGLGAAEAEAFCAALGLRLPAHAELAALAAGLEDGAATASGIFGLRGDVAEWSRCDAGAAGCVDGHTLWPEPSALEPGTAPACHRSPTIGFRCVRDAPAP